LVSLLPPMMRISQAVIMFSGCRILAHIGQLVLVEAERGGANSAPQWLQC
jgi:hypothetical protein